MFEIVNKAEQEIEQENSLKKSILYDFVNRKFILESGNLILSENENELINQWLEWLIRTVPQKYNMFPNEFGVNTDSIIGGKLSNKALQISNIETAIRQNLVYCPVIADITNLQLKQENNSLIVYFEIITKNNEGKGVELSFEN